MKKIITAINNPKLNEELKKENKFEIIGKDIQYREAILEILEKNNNIDLIIISEEILGEIKLEELIEKIKLINEKIKIIFILEKENEKLEKILIKNNIIDIYFNNKINLEELIKIINKKEINMEEEIIKLKKIIEEKNINYEKKENKNIKKDKKDRKVKKNFQNEILEIVKRTKDEIRMKLEKITRKEKKRSRTRYMLTKIITFSGDNKSGKSTLSLIISQYLSEKNYKVLLIDGDLVKQDLTTILKPNKKSEYSKKEKRKENDKNKFRNNYFREKNKNKRRNKYIYGKIKNSNRKNSLKNRRIKLININNRINKRYDKLVNHKNNINYYIINKIVKIFTGKIDKNLYFFNGLNNLFKNSTIKKEKSWKKKSFLLFTILKRNYDFIIIDLSKENEKGVNQEILKNAYINFVLMEANLLGVKEIQKILNLYISDWKISKYSLHIILNKKNFISMNRRLVSKSVLLKNKIFEIKENKFYYALLNHPLKRKILIRNKTIKYELNKIIKNIIFNFK